MKTEQIASFLRIDHAQASLVRAVIHKTLPIMEILEHPKCAAAQRWVNSCYNMPSENEIRMACLDNIIEGFGVEVLGDCNSCHDLHASYVNTGDTYSPTIVFIHDTEEFRLTTWGDIVEQNPDWDLA